MRLLLMFLFFLFSLNLLASELKVETNPSRPVAGEVFQAFFRIFTDEDADPAINFSPANLEVVGKANQGISTRTIYANGKLTVTREVTVVYELVAAKPGTAWMRDITVQIGSTTLRHPTISLTVLKEAEEPADVMVMAEVPKRNLFLGEGVVVRYYLYSKVPVSNLDIKKYPKLNNFLKRFLQEAERTERVSVDGQLYMRTQIYAAKLYPEKTGELKVDSLQLSATYPTSRTGDPFGAFGLNRGELKTRTITSEPVKIEVRPLPEPIPTHFTGLVGPHEFTLEAGQSRLIVNEPLEIKLVVTGVGALENLEAPALLKHPGLEEFESNGDLKISSADQATKVFDYTFLAKENLNLPGKEITLSYFDPNSERYVSTTLKIPEIVVAGGQAAQERKPEKNEPPPARDESRPQAPQLPKELNGPAALQEILWKSWHPYLNLALASLAVLLTVGWIVKNTRGFSMNFRTQIPSSFRRGEFRLGEFIQWMAPLITRTGKSPLGIIKDSPLPEESKRYFIDLLSANDYKDYSANKATLDFKYQSRHFKELGRYIESAHDESSSQPS